MQRERTIGLNSLYALLQKQSITESEWETAFVAHNAIADKGGVPYMRFKPGRGVRVLDRSGQSRSETLRTADRLVLAERPHLTLVH